MIAGPEVPDLLKAIVLGLVEGATEFIPVSSTGHLIVAADWLGFDGPIAKTFEIFIQLGAILAVVWLYRATFLRMLTGWRAQPGGRRLVLNLVLAFIPAAVAGVLLHDWIKTYLFSPRTVAVALVVGGVAILFVERLAPVSGTLEVEQIRPRTALGIGLAQVLSLCPGVSRSGATILGGFALGVSRKAATEFSFFLAVPVMCAATLFDLVKSRGVLQWADVPVLATGFVVSFLTAVVVVRVFLGYVARRDFRVFAWYRILFGAFLLAFYWTSSR